MIILKRIDPDIQDVARKKFPPHFWAISSFFSDVPRCIPGPFILQTFQFCPVSLTVAILKTP